MKKFNVFLLICLSLTMTACGTTSSKNTIKGITAVSSSNDYCSYNNYHNKYDDANRLIEKVNLFGDGSEDLKHSSEYVYDGNGMAEYWGGISSPITLTSYDSNGNIISIKSDNNAEKIYSYYDTEHLKSISYDVEGERSIYGPTIKTHLTNYIYNDDYSKLIGTETYLGDDKLNYSTYIYDGDLLIEIENRDKDDDFNLFSKDIYYYYGKGASKDLVALWQHVYKKSEQDEFTVGASIYYQYDDSGLNEYETHYWGSGCDVEIIK